MPITPDDLAARFAPPVSAAALQTRAADFTAAAYALAEQAMDALPRGHHLDNAVEALESAAHWVSAGLAAVEADGIADQLAAEAAEQQIPLVLDPAAVQLAPPIEAGLGDLDLNLSLYRTCVRTSRLYPIARLVALTLTDVAGEHGFIADVDQPTLDELCMGTGCGPHDVLAALEELAIGGWIGRLNVGDGAPTRYQLRMPAAAPH
jgi:hypothetical protein